MKLKDLAAFLGLSIAWGSSFFWIKIALQELGPFQLVGYRLLFGILGLLIVIWFKKPEWPKEKNIWWALAIMGLTNTAIPFLLISWGEQFIDSTVASILNGMVPLFTMVIAHFWLEEERMTLARSSALLIGFFGVLILVSRDISGDLQAGVLGQIAVLVAAMLYAFSAVFNRRNLKGISPFVQAFITLIVADSLIWSMAAIIERPIIFPRENLVILSIVWLGLIGSCLAYLLYFYLIHSIGPTRTAMVTYVFPVVGISLGVLFLDEVLDWQLIVGGILVFTSVVVANRKAKE